MTIKHPNIKQEVINRAIRIKVFRKLKPLKPYFDAFFLFKLRIEIKFEQRNKRKVLDQTIKVSVDEIKKINSEKFEAMYNLFNIGLYFLIAERDILSLKADAFTHSDIWKRNLSLRIILLIMYERDMSKVANGKIMKEIYQDINISEDSKKEMIKALRELSKAQSKAQYLLKDIRNEITAHRDQNSLLQYEKIKSMHILQFKDLFNVYYNASDTFIKILPKVVKESSKLTSLLKQHAKYTHN